MRQLENEFIALVIFWYQVIIDFSAKSYLKILIIDYERYCS
jgi:hypothetical protein